MIVGPSTSRTDSCRAQRGQSYLPDLLLRTDRAAASPVGLDPPSGTAPSQGRSSDGLRPLLTWGLGWPASPTGSSATTSSSSPLSPRSCVGGYYDVSSHIQAGSTDHCDRCRPRRGVCPSDSALHLSFARSRLCGTSRFEVRRSEGRWCAPAARSDWSRRARRPALRYGIPSPIPT